MRLPAVKNQKGFTLIEVIVYAAILAGFFVFSITFASRIIEYAGHLEKQRELGENQRFLEQKLQWVLSGIQTVAAPQEGIASSTLSVTKANFLYNPVIVTWANGAVRLSLQNGTPVALTNRFATVTSLAFDQMNLAGQHAVRVRTLLQNDVATTSIDMMVYYK